MPRRFPKQMWNVRAKRRSLPDYMEPHYWADEMLRSESAASALRRVQKKNPFKRYARWEVLPVQGPELPAPLEEYRLRERARQEEADRQARRDALVQMRSMPGPWRFEVSDNDAAAMRGAGVDGYWHFNAPSWRDGMEAMAVLGTNPPRLDRPFSIEDGFRDALKYDEVDLASMTDDELEDFVGNVDGDGGWPTLLRLTGPDNQVYSRFDTDPRRFWDYDPPRNGFRGKAIKGIKFRSR